MVQPMPTLEEWSIRRADRGRATPNRQSPAWPRHGHNVGMELVRRVMVADFDSVRQMEMWQREGAAEAERRLTAMLRLAVLLEGRLILTDSQLLDGIYFLTHGPAGIARLLGCNPERIPLTVSLEGRFHSLEESLLAKKASPAFEWSSQQAIAGASDVETRRLIQAHDRRRADWLEAADSGWIERTSFERFSFDIFEEHWDATCWPTVAAGSQSPSSALEKLGLAGCTARSDARDLIEQNFGPLSDPQPRLVYQRWDAAYQNALATCNDASLLSFSRGGADGGVPLRGSIRLDGTLLDQLAEIEGSVNALVSHRARSAVENWRESPNREAAHDIAFAVTDTLAASPSRGSVLSGAVFRLTTPLLLSLAVLLITLGGWGTRAWAIFVAFLGFIAAIPWAEVPAISHARKGRLRAIIRLELQ